jgi:hypothetical protein
VCVCVCERERERERERESDKETKRERASARERERARDKYRARERQRDRENGTLITKEGRAKRRSEGSGRGGSGKKAVAGHWQGTSQRQHKKMLVDLHSGTTVVCLCVMWMC